MIKKLLLILFFTVINIYAGTGTDNINIILTPSTKDCKDLNSSTTTSSFQVTINSPLPYKIYNITIEDPDDSKSKIDITKASKTNISGSYTYRASEGIHKLEVLLSYTNGSLKTVKTGEVTIKNSKKITCPGEQ